MKKYIIGLLWLSVVSSGVFAWDLQDMLNQSEKLLSANGDTMIQSLHQKGITIFDSLADFKPNNNIRRDEAAKMFTIASDFVGTKKEETTSMCKFSDKHLAWADLQDLLTTSCEKWLFQWSNGKFNPTGNITNAQAVTVAGRMLYGKQDESVGHYATKYYELAQNNWLLNNLSISDENKRNLVATRQTVATLIYNVLSK